ncbi:dihydropteroate synthase [Subtercola frigoramans]|uniref:Dihydropteroate synthase n=2 Tax=Subtercola frigoramans TaxID=120298 RepID=A0ABS2L264_9MICO|nr:dihydropteroate synthase [Subtercola frigoramans]MBM7471138.1 dihydropteroate synthase [Subtercola frigoramans]
MSGIGEGLSRRRRPAIDVVPATFEGLPKGRTLIMGIVNVTTDSFSDGGRWLRSEAAIQHALELVAAGADLIDVGGESTRPGARRVPVAEEQHRVVPVIRELARRGVALSIDTMNASTARAAIEAGAILVNDVSGTASDPLMTPTIIELEAPIIVSHWRGHSDTMNSRAVYADVVAEVRAELEYQVAELVVRGVRIDRLLVDPGLGFAKNSEHNWKILGHLDALTSFGLPVVVGASRKRFIGELLPAGAAMEERDFGSAVAAALAAQAGAWAVRVHDIETTTAALAVAEAWKTGALDE